MSASRLEGLAYRMLGSVADAEDVVQEARLRLLRQAQAPDNEDAWLFRVVTNLSLDRLREQKRRREDYPGPWLPEPLPTEGPDQIAELAEDLSMGFVHMLERLSPVERAVFVLREGFDLSFDDIGAALNASASSCRQRYRRAKVHLQAPQPRNQESPDTQKAMLERLLTVVADRDLEGLIDLFSEDSVAYADGGGVVSAAIIPITDPRRIAQVTMHTTHKLMQEGEVGFHWQLLNGAPGLLVTLDGELVSTLQLEVVDGHIQSLYLVRNPEKLAHLGALLK